MLTTSEGAAVISFGLQTTSGVLMDLVRVVLSPEGRLKHRESMVRFLERLGVDAPKLSSLPPLPIQESLGVADEMVISTGQVSEAIFCGLSIAAISTGLVEEVPLQGLLRVQGTPALFSNLIRLLYLDEATSA
ncbi:MAG: hypothetical protein J0L84_02275 [Verrucomicrobia bacterium]|nr:hypothetical protein [Verrucomicrobiota bacterium]